MRAGTVEISAIVGDIGDITWVTRALTGANVVVFQGPIVFVGLGCTPADTLKLQCTPRDVTGPAHRNLSRAH